LDFHARCESVQEMSSQYPVLGLCELAEISRAGYYKWKNRELAWERRQNQEADLKAHMLSIHRLRPYFGVPRMQMALRREGFHVNHKKVRRLMRELSIRSVIRRKRPFAGRKPSVCFANVLNRAFASEAPGQKLVTDVTYVRTGNTFVYLSVVMDLYNNEVKAWVLSERNDLKLVTDTMEQLDDQPGLMHSDQGFQYTTKTYAHILQTKGLTGSHSRRGNCFDNACIESFFSHLKTEKLYLDPPQTLEEARSHIAHYLTYYNEERFQRKLNGLSPKEFRDKTVA